ncbi:hypothetical protein FRC04_004548 [Tulasnella sp. 424]|nr:hypothetical protein FRC04_004548 [Tulasnella sp. 424]
MEAFVTDISNGLAEDIGVSTIAESAVDAVIDALRSDMNSTGESAKSSTLLDVDREMDVLVVARELFSSILARRIAALRRQHNAMLPINKLPAELLASIISISVHSQTWSIAALWNLASICSRWWHIIITTPSLWTTARMFKQPQLALRKSKGLPITVRVQYWNHSEGEMKQFMEIVGPQSHRWQFVFIQTTFTDLLSSHLGRPLHQLEGLSLGYHGGWGGSSRQVALGAIPKLRHLRLTRITLDWRMLTQISLETLSLRNLRQAHAPKLQELYQILASSPRLTSLTLFELEEAVDADGFQGEPLFLTRLRTMEISRIGEQTAIGLTNLLRAENLHGLTMLVKMQGSSKPSDFQALLRPSQRSGLLSSAIRNQAWKVVYAKIGPESLELSDKVIVGRAAPGPLSLRISGASGYPLLLYLGGHDRGYDIDLDITDSRLRREDFDQVLRLIDPLVLRVGSDHVYPTMMALSTLPPPSQKWICPHLGEVHLMSTSLPDRNTIVDTLQVRNGLVETVLPEGRSRLSVYNAAGEVFVTETASFSPKTASPSPALQTFAMNNSSSLLEGTSAFAIAESAVDAVIHALHSEAVNSSRPSAKLTALPTIDQKMDVVVAAQGIFSNILAQRMAAVRRQQNAMLPINKLPTELIARIIWGLLHSKTWSISTLSSLASVCSRWWRIIISTPSLWMTARMFQRPDLVVQKSKALSFMVYAQDWHHSEDDMRRFAEIVGPHACRWHSLSIRTRFIKHILPYLDDSLPRLERLSLATYGDMEGPTNRLTLGATPNLRRLELSGIGMKWSSIARIPLESLSLTYLHRSHVPEMQQLRQILASSPRLRSLALRGLEDPVDAEGFSAEAVALKSLCVLDISNIGNHILVGIAKMLQAETLLSLIATFTIRPGSDVSHLANLLRPSSEDSPLLSVVRNRRLNSVYVKISGKSFKLSDRKFLDDTPRARLAVEVRGVAGYEILLLLGSPDRGYDIDLDTTEYELEGEELIRALRIIDPLALRIGRQHVMSVAKALSNDLAVPETWFCPNLQHLHLSVGSCIIGEIAEDFLPKDRLEGTGAAAGRPRLLVYDSNGGVHSPKAVSVKHRGRTSDGTYDHQNVE